MAWGSRTDLIGAYTTAAAAALHVSRFLSAKKRGETYSSELAISLPADLFTQLAIDYLDPQSIKLMLSTCGTWRAQESRRNSGTRCKAHYPRVEHMLESMPKPHPPWRQLYLQQLRAERPLRCEAAGMLPTTTSLSDYFYGVEIYGEKNRPPLVAKYGRLGPTAVCVIAWTGPTSRPLRKSSRTSARMRGRSRRRRRPAAWIASGGWRIASELRMRIFITRPGGDTFCLYDGFVSRTDEDGDDIPLEIQSDMTKTHPEMPDDEDDAFFLNLVETALPLRAQLLTT